MDTATSALLSLPRELRDQIWRFAFTNQNVRPYRSACENRPDCHACELVMPQSNSLLSYSDAIRPLLINKQIYDEARVFLDDSMVLHISSQDAIEEVGKRRSSRYANTKHLTLYTHLDDESRTSWFSQLEVLSLTFPNLQRIKIHCHMRAPTSYANLVDAIFILGPLVRLPPHLRPSLTKPPAVQTPQTILDRARRSISTRSRSTSNPTPLTPATTSATSGSNTRQPAAESSLQDDVAHSQAEAQTPKENDLNPNFEIHFAYLREEVLFESSFMGAVTTSDAIDEHESVLRDCLVSEDYRSRAAERDIQGMANTLFEIARVHEQSWLESLRRRRTVSEASSEFSDSLGEMEGGGEWGVDPNATNMSNEDIDRGDVPYTAPF